MSKVALDSPQSFGQRLIKGWDQFWFSKSEATTLGLMRILAGAVIFYTHVVWTFEFEAFFSRDQLLPLEHNRIITDSDFAWSHFRWIESSSVLWGIHFVALASMFLFCLGAFTRVTSILTALFTISYANRAVGAAFGLDQINVLLAFYLAIGPSGNSLSLDAWWRKRKTGPLSPAPSTLAHFVTRLIQLHLCIIYLFAGSGKLLGSTWWNGEAIWGAMANSEYQTIDMTWLAAYPYAINFITHLTLFWEVSYFILVWPKWSRPIVIAIAFAVHLGIGISMGMVEFGLIMVIANLAFVSPSLIGNTLLKIGVGANNPPNDSPTA